MSSQPPQAVYLPAGLVLPYYARPDLAWTQNFNDGTAPAGLVYRITPEDGTFMYVPTCHFTVTTGATVATRTIVAQYYDAYGNLVWEVPAPVTQSASQTYTYTFVSGSGSSLSVGVAGLLRNLSYMPQQIIAPGEALYLSSIFWQSTDQMGPLGISKLSIPTGPEQQQQALPPVAVSFA